MAAILLQAFPFVHPAIAAVALGTGLIPIIVHLVNRRRYVRVPWAAMAFLLAANQLSSRRIRLEQFLLLLTRILVIVLLGLAVARPFVPASVRLGGLPLSASRVHRLLLIDNSLSMNARTETGETRFKLAKRSAESLLDSFPATDAVSLVTLASGAEAVIAQPAYDRRFVRERLAAVGPTQRATQAVEALEVAIEILKTSEFATGNQAVYLISDLPRRIWRSETPDSPTPAIRALRRLADTIADPTADPKNRYGGLTVVRVSPGADEPDMPGLANVGVTRLDLASPLVGLNLPVGILAEVTNFGSVRSAGLVMQVRRDGQIIRRQQLPTLSPQESTVVSIATEFSTPGTSLLEARISAPTQDALEDDDTRYLSVEVRDATPVLLVDGRPGATRLGGEAGFLATALAPEVRASHRGSQTLGAEATLIQPRIISEPELPGEALSDYDVIALCNVRRLAAQTWKQLEVFVAKGGGLLIFAGDLVSVENYNRFGYAGGTGLLPGELGRAVAASSDTSAFVGFQVGEVSHAIVSEFADHAQSGLFSARVDRYLPIRLDSQRGEVVLQYTNADPALVLSIGDYGLGIESQRNATSENGHTTLDNRQSPRRGRVLLCTTTADMDWNNLPSRGDYVSLMLSAVTYLSRRHGDHRNVSIGQLIHERLTSVQSSLPLRVTAHGGAVKQGRGLTDGNVGPQGLAPAAGPSLVPSGDTLALQYGPIERAGPLAVSIGSEVLAFAANVDSAESKLITTGRREFAAALDRPVNLVTDGGALADRPVAARSTELASMALWAVVGLLLLEVWMAARFGSQGMRPSRGL